MDNNEDIKVDVWFTLNDDFFNEDNIICPGCKSRDIETAKEVGADGWVFLHITCNECGKSGYIARGKAKGE